MSGDKMALYLRSGESASSASTRKLGRGDGIHVKDGIPQNAYSPTIDYLEEVFQEPAEKLNFAEEAPITIRAKSVTFSPFSLRNSYWITITKIHFLVSRKIMMFYVIRFGLCRVFLHYRIPLLSCKYESLTQGNRLNPNHDGSSTERLCTE